MVTKSDPAERFMLQLLTVAAQELAELQATTDIKAIYRIEGRARAMVSMARLAAVARPVTDNKGSAAATEGGTMDGDAAGGTDVREQLERRLEQLQQQIERKRAELADLEGQRAGIVPERGPRRRGDAGAALRLEPDGA